MLFAVSLAVASYLGGPQTEAVQADDLAFLTGSWRGEVGGSVIEETWLAPVAGNLTGVFRMTGNDKVDLVEIMTLTETDEGLMYRLRHFDTALVPWKSEADGPIEAKAVLVDSDSVRFEFDESDDLEAIAYDRDDDMLTARVIFRAEGRDPFVLVFEKAE